MFSLSVKVADVLGLAMEYFEEVKPRKSSTIRSEFFDTD